MPFADRLVNLARFQVSQEAPSTLSPAVEQKFRHARPQRIRLVGGGPLDLSHCDGDVVYTQTRQACVLVKTE